MKRYAMTATLKDDPEIIRRYDEYHAHPWPQVPDGFRRCGVQRLFIYRFGRQLFMFMETRDDFDFDRDLPKCMDDPKVREWDALMASFQEPAPGTPPESNWATMKEVYSQDE